MERVRLAEILSEVDRKEKSSRTFPTEFRRWERPPSNALRVHLNPLNRFGPARETFIENRSTRCKFRGTMRSDEKHWKNAVVGGAARGTRYHRYLPLNRGKTRPFFANLWPSFFHPVFCPALPAFDPTRRIRICSTQQSRKRADFAGWVGTVWQVPDVASARHRRVPG